MPERTALVTGATSGIGAAAARALSQAGFTVWVSGRDPDNAQRVAADVGGHPLALDVTDAASIAAAADQLGELDALVNNAGVQPDFGVSLLEAGPDVFRASYETNVFAVAAVTNALLPALRRSPAGRIVNVSSGTASFTWSTGPNPQFDHEAAASSGGRFGVYRSSKAALNMITLLYAQALAGDGIKVNALAPGVRATNLNPSTGHGGDPAEAAPEIVTLASLPDDGPTGQLFSYDGSIAPW